jgi:tRNA-2-methylthio-N6-dimethylallyladenosine synthase
MDMSITANTEPNKKACVVTFGCQQNEADSEKIKGVLASMGYNLVGEDFLNECNVIVMNTCAIREHAELKAFSRTGQLKHYKKINKDLLIGICGCMVEQEHRAEYIKKSFPYVDFLFGTHSLHKFPEILSNALKKKKRPFVREPEIDDAKVKIKLV